MLKNIRHFFICSALSLSFIAGNYADTALAEVTVKDVSVVDIVKIKQSILGKVVLSSDEEEKYDLNGDSKINVIDLSAVKSAVIYDKKPDMMNLNVGMVVQNPELPTGCEVTALTMVLNFFGHDADKLEIDELVHLPTLLEVLKGCKTKEEKERKMQEAIIEIKKKYGKNSILKAMNLQEKATARKRNKLVGGHNGE